MIFEFSESPESADRLNNLISIFESLHSKMYRLSRDLDSEMLEEAERN